MRINKFIAQSTSLSRRDADSAIADGRVEINDTLAMPGDIVVEGDNVTLDSHRIEPSKTKQTIMLNKPVGYVVSRNGQGSPTIYDLLPNELHSLNPVGRLDKNSSGLLIMTNDGDLANTLTHPSYEKVKQYQVQLNDFLSSNDILALKQGVDIGDRTLSSLKVLGPLKQAQPVYTVKMSEGRNRQIRRTFKELGLKVIRLHRTHFGPYEIKDLNIGEYLALDKASIDRY